MHIAKSNLRALFAVLTLGFALMVPLAAQDAASAPASPVQADLKALVDKIMGKMQGGANNAEAFAPEIAEFDALLGKYPEKSADVAEIAWMKAMLYLQVLNDDAAGKKCLEEVVANYPGTEQAKRAAGMLNGMTPEVKAVRAAKEAELEAKLATLAGKPAPELNFTWSSKAGLKHVSDLKGRVVILDFFATWCGPCIASFPKVREEVAHFKDSPVTFLGVTSLQGQVFTLEANPIDTKGNPRKEYELMSPFMKKHEMTWEVAFSEQPLFNPDYAVSARGVPYVAIIDPNGVIRHAGLNPHDPKADVEGKITAILKEFKLPVPAAN